LLGSDDSSLEQAPGILIRHGLGLATSGGAFEPTCANQPISERQQQYHSLLQMSPECALSEQQSPEQLSRHRGLQYCSLSIPMINGGRLGRIRFRVPLIVVAIVRLDPCGDGLVDLYHSNARHEDRPDRQRGRHCRGLFRRFGSHIGQHGHIIETTFAEALVGEPNRPDRKADLLCSKDGRSNPSKS
jgi:hypothetical protein